jgi:hypothetical protein
MELISKDVQVVLRIPRRTKMDCHEAFAAAALRVISRSLWHFCRKVGVDLKCHTGYTGPQSAGKG